MAVHVSQTYGGQAIDVGLVEEVNTAINHLATP